jgi:hypothetical protein
MGYDFYVVTELTAIVNVPALTSTLTSRDETHESVTEGSIDSASIVELSKALRREERYASPFFDEDYETTEEAIQREVAGYAELPTKVLFCDGEWDKRISPNKRAEYVEMFREMAQEKLQRYEEDKEEDELLLGFATPKEAYVAIASDPTACLRMAFIHWHAYSR